MRIPSLVLLISEDDATVQSVRDSLLNSGEKLTVQQVERTRTAAARIAGGGVGAVLLDISSGNREGKRNEVPGLRADAPGLPLIILCEAEQEALAQQMVDEGATSFVVRDDWPKDLTRKVLAELESGHSSSRRAHRASSPRAPVIAIAGAKGGVGTTTVAVNVAAVMAATSKLILAELRPPFGSLCHFFRPHRAARGLQNLLAISEIEVEREDVESCLWPNRSIPGLSVLFTSERTGNWFDVGAEQASEVVRVLAESSETLVVDLAASLSDWERGIFEAADTLALVVERDSLSIDSAKSKARWKAWGSFRNRLVW